MHQCTTASYVRSKSKPKEIKHFVKLWIFLSNYFYQKRKRGERAGNAFLDVYVFLIKFKITRYVDTSL